MKRKLSLRLKIIVIAFLLTGLNSDVKAQEEINDIELNLISVKGNLASIVDSLIAIAENKTINREVRRSAIFLLGEIQTAASIEYLLSNIDMFLMKKVTISDSSQFQEWPSNYILNEKVKDGWVLIPFIYKRLEEDLNDKEILLIRELMLNKFGEKMTKVILLERKMSSKARANTSKIF